MCALSTSPSGPADQIIPLFSSNINPPRENFGAESSSQSAYTFLEPRHGEPRHPAHALAPATSDGRRQYSGHCLARRLGPFTEVAADNCSVQRQMLGGDISLRAFRHTR